MSRSFATELREQAALWLVTPEVGQEVLVGLACDALVAGVSSPGLVALAGMSLRAHEYGFESAVSAALTDVGFALPPRESTDALIDATRAMARQLVNGHMSAPQLTRWAHFHVGHQGPTILQALVELDDAYDVNEYVMRTGEDLDAAVLAEARKLVTEITPARAAGGPDS